MYQALAHSPQWERMVFVLTFVVMLAFQPLLKKYFPQQATPQQQTQAQRRE